MAAVTTRVHRTVLAVVLALAVAVVATACNPGHATTTATDVWAAPTSASTARAQLEKLTVAVEDTGNHYNREADWPHWDTARDAGRGCDIRDKVLQQQGHNIHTSTDGSCTITGTWTSPYDGLNATRTSQIQIDHMVPLKEAAQSGTRSWSRADRERFANDTRFLVAASVHSNEQKSDGDPADWQPLLRTSWCTYAVLWITDKTTYHLTVDRAEKSALVSMLATCTR